MVKKLDNFNSRLYYVDPFIIVSDMPKEECAVMWQRREKINMSKAQATLRRIGFELSSDHSKVDREGNLYYLLKKLENSNGEKES